MGDAQNGVPLGTLGGSLVWLLGFLEEGAPFWDCSKADVDPRENLAFLFQVPKLVLSKLSLCHIAEEQLSCLAVHVQLSSGSFLCTFKVCTPGRGSNKPWNVALD